MGAGVTLPGQEGRASPAPARAIARFRKGLSFISGPPDRARLHRRELAEKSQQEGLRLGTLYPVFLAVWVMAMAPQMAAASPIWWGLS